MTPMLLGCAEFEARHEKSLVFLERALWLQKGSNTECYKAKYGCIALKAHNCKVHHIAV